MERPSEWDAYEQAVMDGRGDEVESPGDDYVMSEAFEAWLVDAMRKEVMQQAFGAIADIQPKMREKA